MRNVRFLLALPLLALLGGLPEADAAPKTKGAAAAKEEKLPKIEPTGISEFDSVFMKAKTIHETLDANDTKLKEGRKQLAIALGVAEDAPLKTAFDDLKVKANGKIKLAMKGKMPRLAASEAMPDNVQKGIDAVNGLLDTSEAVMDETMGLKPEAEALAAACVDFPAKLGSMGLDPMKLAQATGKVSNNVKATGATPDRVERVGKSAEGVFVDVKGTFTE